TQIVIMSLLKSIQQHTKSKRDWSSDVCTSDLIVRRFLAVSVSHENIAVGSNRDFGWLVKSIQTGSRHSGFAKSQNDFAALVEFEDLLAPAVFDSVVGHPEIAVVVYGNLVWTHKQSFAKALQELAGGIEFKNGMERRVGGIGAAR